MHQVANFGHLRVTTTRDRKCIYEVGHLIPGIGDTVPEVCVCLEVVEQQRYSLVPQRGQVFVDVRGEVLHEGEEMRTPALDEGGRSQDDEPREDNVRPGDVDQVGVVHFVVGRVRFSLLLGLRKTCHLKEG